MSSPDPIDEVVVKEVQNQLKTWKAAGIMPREAMRSMQLDPGGLSIVNPWRHIGRIVEKKLREFQELPGAKPLDRRWWKHGTPDDRRKR